MRVDFSCQIVDNCQYSDNRRKPKGNHFGKPSNSFRSCVRAMNPVARSASLSTPFHSIQPRFLNWAGWSVRLWGCSAYPTALRLGHGRRNDAEWLFHSKELQRRHAPPEPCNPPRSVATRMVMATKQHMSIGNITLSHQVSGQLRNLGSRRLPRRDSARHRTPSIRTENPSRNTSLQESHDENHRRHPIRHPRRLPFG